MVNVLHRIRRMLPLESCVSGRIEASILSFLVEKMRPTGQVVHLLPTSYV